jgi:hypothetical protein
LRCLERYQTPRQGRGDFDLCNQMNRLLHMIFSTKVNLGTILPLMIAALTLIYGILDYSGIMDKWRGRTAAMALWERLSTVPSGDSVIIFNDNKYFTDGVALMIKYTRNSRIQEMNSQDIIPTAIARLGGISLPPGIGQMPPWDSISRFYASPSSPVSVAYNYTYNDRGGGWGQPLGSLGEIVDWTNESREGERFFVYTILLGILSIVVAIQEIKKKHQTG